MAEPGVSAVSNNINNQNENSSKSESTQIVSTAEKGIVFDEVKFMTKCYQVLSLTVVVCTTLILTYFFLLSCIQPLF